MQRALLSATFLSAAAMALPSPAQALDVYLAAVRTCVLPSGLNGGACTVSATPGTADPVPVWSFVQISAAEYGAKSLQPATLANAVVPGPLLTADAGDTAGLKVHLLNMLPVPVSLVVPGLPGPLSPVWFNPATGLQTGTGARPSGDTTSRVRSLNAETASGATHDYSFPLIPGSFLYESGTHQAIQVQMGLHGPLIVASGTTAPNQTTGTAYPGITYAQQVSTYLSEIDAAVHRTVDASPTHDATPAGGATTSPLEYWPNIFLTSQFVLGADQSLAPRNEVVVKQPTLMRFFNGTLRSHVQVVQNNTLSVVAEDGQPYRYAKNQYSVLLDAGKTKDAVMIPATVEHVAVYDRMLNTGNAGNTQQGLLAGFDVASVSTPIAYNDKYTGPYGVKLVVTALQGVLANDKSHDQQTLSAAVVTNPQYGSLSLAADGSFSYTPTAGSNKTTDSFSYKATETVNGTVYASQQATVSLAFTATAPVAVADTYYVAKGGTLSVAVPGVLGNDTPASGNTATLQTGPTHSKSAFSLATAGSFTYTPVTNYSGTDSFTYGISNPAGSSSATATINVLPPPAAAADAVTLTHGTSTPINVLFNDAGAAGAKSVSITKSPTKGTATVNPDLSITYTAGAVAGTDTFQYTFTSALTVPSTAATVTVTIK